MAVRKINESTLTAIGNAIRSKTGGSALINPEDMANEIASIQTGSEEVTTAYVTIENDVSSVTVSYLDSLFSNAVGTTAWVAWLHSAPEGWLPTDKSFYIFAVSKVSGIGVLKSGANAWDKGSVTAFIYSYHIGNGRISTADGVSNLKAGMVFKVVGVVQ